MPRFKLLGSPIIPKQVLVAPSGDRFFTEVLLKYFFLPKQIPEFRKTSRKTSPHFIRILTQTRSNARSPSAGTQF